LFEIAKSSPDIHIRRGSLSFPCDTGFYNFGYVDVFTSRSVTFTVENNGSAVLNITGISFLEESVTWFTIDNSSMSSVLEEGESTFFTIRFKPVYNEYMSAKVILVSNDQDEDPYKFTVTGHGSEGSEPDINVRQEDTYYPDGSTYYFEDTPIGLSSLPVPFTIENKGQAELKISSILLKGQMDDFELDISSSSFLLPGGEDMTVTITFILTKVKKRKARLVIASDDPDESGYIVNLEGYGVE